MRRAVEGPEEPGHVVGLNAAEAGVVDVGRMVAGRREAVDPRHDAPQQLSCRDGGKSISHSSNAAIRRRPAAACAEGCRRFADCR